MKIILLIKKLFSKEATAAKENALKVLSKSSRFENFVYLWNNSFNKTAVYSEQPIEYSRFFGFGSSLSYVLKLTGKPDHILENREGSLDILVYLMHVRNSDLRFELHFHEEKLFFINYTYLNISQGEKEAVLRSIGHKYGVDLEPSFAFNSILIDKSGNAMVFNDDGNFSVNYLAPSSKADSISKAFAMSSKRVG